MTDKPSSLYIHIPFCSHICDYCDFAKVVYFKDFAESYLKRLKEELSTKVDNFHLKTIYVGGGTPTSLSNEQFLLLLKMIEPYAKEVQEYTFEANPESLSLSKLKMMKEYGVNRLSIGVESSKDEILKKLNRHHTFKDVKTAIANAKKIGFDNINVDLILGLPNVSIDDVKKDIDHLLSLKIQHISTYALTVHEHTVFHLKNIQEEDQDKSREKYDLVHEKLLKNGFIHYEISNFCLPGFASQHNLTYWKNEHYYGIGLGAAGYINHIRYCNTKSLDKYLKGDYEDEKEKVTLKDEFIYQLMLNLRTNIGVDLLYLKDHFQVDLLANEKVNELIKNHDLYLKDNHLIPTYEGMMILDYILLNIIE